MKELSRPNVLSNWVAATQRSAWLDNAAESEETMFGFGKKDHDVRLTDDQYKKLTKNMSKSERKAFERKQKQAREDREWDALMMAELFWDEDD